jgi:hypothetical protein
MFPAKLKIHDYWKLKRPLNKTRKLLCMIVFIYLVIFGFFFLIILGLLIEIVFYYLGILMLYEFY